MYSNFDLFENAIHQVILSFNVARSARESIFIDYDCDRVNRVITIDTHCIEFRYTLVAVFEHVSFPNFHSEIKNGRIVLKYLG